MRYIGVDVGLTGGIAFVDSDGGHRTYDMPVWKVKGKRKLDEIAIKHIFKSLILNNPEETFTIIEKQQPFHKQGLVSTFGLGVQYGFLRGLLVALGMPFEEVRPQTWQKEFGIVKEPNTKSAAYGRASNLFPSAELKTKRGKIIDGRCDSLLLSEYGRRKHIR